MKRTPTRLFIFIALLLFGSVQVMAQISNWTQMASGELEGADLRCYLWHKNTLFAGTRGGIFRTTNKGLQWTYSSAGLSKENSPEINCLAVLDDTLFAGTTYGLARSVDGGNTWTPCTDAGGVRQYIDRIFILGNALVISGKDASNAWRIFRSTDKGKTWTSGTHTFTNRPELYKVHNDFIFINRGRDSLYKTFDGIGVTYFPTFNLPIKAAAESFCGDSTSTSPFVYAIINNASVYRLNINTGLWDDSVNTIFPRAELYTLTYFNGKLLVCGIDYNPHFDPYIYVSYDKGFNWTKLVNTFGVSFPLLQNVVWLGGNELMGSFFNENYYSTNGGLNWGKRSGGLYAGKTANTVSVNNVLLTSYIHKGVIRSTDNGLNWLPSNLGMDSAEVFVSNFQVTRNRVYVSLRFYLGDSMKLYTSANNGANWTPCKLPAGMFEFDLIGANDSTLFIRNKTGTNRFIYRSTDNGNTFVSIQSKLPADYTSGTGTINSIVGSRDTLVTLGVNGFGTSSIYYSTDNGENYTAANTGIPTFVGAYIMKLLPGETSFMAVGRNINDSVKYLINGAWVNAKGSNLPEALKLYVVDQVGKRLFASTNRGIYLSDNFGFSWIYIDNGPNGGVSISKFVGTSQYLFAATENDGIWRNTLQVGVSPVRVQEVNWNVYPNPANNLVTLMRPENAEGAMEIQLMDQQGRTVKKQWIQTGDQTAELQVDDLKTGLYFYRISGATLGSGKLLVIH